MKLGALCVAIDWFVAFRTIQNCEAYENFIEIDEGEFFVVVSKRVRLPYEGTHWCYRILTIHGMLCVECEELDKFTYQALT